MIDIVITTCERLSLLKQTLTYIWNRTRTPYRLQIIDDASSDGTSEYLLSLLEQKKVNKVIFNGKRLGIPANLKLFNKITISDVIVFTDDDVLCPNLEPDWLAQGLEAMKEFPEIGLLGLNNPQCNIGDKRGRLQRHGKITFCRNISGHFVFTRKDLLNKLTVSDKETSPIKAMCFKASDAGYIVGYLNDVWCQHIGIISIRNKKDLSKEIALVKPINIDTLEPCDMYKG